jgi:hypothetical protein
LLVTASRDLMAPLHELRGRDFVWACLLSCHWGCAPGWRMPDRQQAGTNRNPTKPACLDDPWAQPQPGTGAKLAGRLRFLTEQQEQAAPATRLPHTRARGDHRRGIRLPRIKAPKQAARSRRLPRAQPERGFDTGSSAVLRASSQKIQATARLASDCKGDANRFFSRNPVVHGMEVGPTTCRTRVGQRSPWCLP